METYYQINGEDMLGILSKEPKRYDSLDEAIKVLRQLLNYSGVDDKYISCFDSVDASAEKEVVIFKDDEDGDSLVYDYRYWIERHEVESMSSNQNRRLEECYIIESDDTTFMPYDSLEEAKSALKRYLRNKPRVKWGKKQGLPVATTYIEVVKGVFKRDNQFRILKTEYEVEICE